MKRIQFVGPLLALCLSIAATDLFATVEGTVKAAFLYNFAKFIQWPDEQRPTLRLCVMGDSVLGKAFDGLIGKPVRNMLISVRHAIVFQDIPQCDLVFLPATQARSLERVRQIVNGYPILIVTENTDTLAKGAIVTLIPSDDRIVFEVDLTVARQLGLQVSAKMLQLARKVY